MKVLIFCGGKGTRLREETEFHPKPMIQIGGKPILWHIMKLFHYHGLDDFVLLLGYKQEVIREYFLNYRHMTNDIVVELGADGTVEVLGNRGEQWRVTLLDTGLDTPKGGRLKLAEPFLDGDEFMLTYGDGVSDVDIGAVLEAHQRSGRMVTFTGVHPVSRFATVRTDDAGNIVEWTEKARLEGYINGGFFVVNRAALAYIDYGCEFEEEPMRRMAQEGQVHMYPHNGFWQCMDTYRDYLALEELWQSDTCPWRVWETP